MLQAIHNSAVYPNNASVQSIHHSLE